MVLMLGTRLNEDLLGEGGEFLSHAADMREELLLSRPTLFELHDYFILPNYLHSLGLPYYISPYMNLDTKCEL